MNLHIISSSLFDDDISLLVSESKHLNWYLSKKDKQFYQYAYPPKQHI